MRVFGAFCVGRVYLLPCLQKMATCNTSRWHLTTSICNVCALANMSRRWQIWAWEDNNWTCEKWRDRAVRKTWYYSLANTHAPCHTHAWCEEGVMETAMETVSLYIAEKVCVSAVRLQICLYCCWRCLLFHCLFIGNAWQQHRGCPSDGFPNQCLS